MSKSEYPNSPCNKFGYLTVQEHPQHQIYWEEYGFGDGEPVMFLHGGPGAGCHKSFARFFNPERYRGILFDQRGCGKSAPSAGDDDATAALTDNTTEHLIGDVLRLRRELNIHGKMHVFGGSWGSTLRITAFEEQTSRWPLARVQDAERAHSRRKALPFCVTGNG